MPEDPPLGLARRLLGKILQGLRCWRGQWARGPGTGAVLRRPPCETTSGSAAGCPLVGTAPWPAGSAPQGTVWGLWRHVRGWRWRWPGELTGLLKWRLHCVGGHTEMRALGGRAALLKANPNARLEQRDGIAKLRHPACSRQCLAPAGQQPAYHAGNMLICHSVRHWSSLVKSSQHTRRERKRPTFFAMPPWGKSLHYCNIAAKTICLPVPLDCRSGHAPLRTAFDLINNLKSTWRQYKKRCF